MVNCELIEDLLNRVYIYYDFHRKNIRSDRVLDISRDKFKLDGFYRNCYSTLDKERNSYL